MVSDIPSNRIVVKSDDSSCDVGVDGLSLSNKTKLIDAADQGALDGLRVDRDGNLWRGWGRQLRQEYAKRFETLRLAHH